MMYCGGAAPFSGLAPSIEDGGHWASEVKSKRRMRVRRRLFLVGVLALIAGALYRARWRELSQAEDILNTMRAFAATRDISCVTTKHVGRDELRWLLMGDRVYMAPQILYLAGTKIRTAEELTHCDENGSDDGETVVIDRVRNEIVHFIYEKGLSFFGLLHNRATEVLTGDAAVCAQHAIELFRGGLKCEKPLGREEL